MEREELEQIPWSALVAEVNDGPDRRWVWFAAAAGLAVACFLLLRLLIPGGQPVAGPTSTTVAPLEGTAVAEGEVIVSEADLRMDHPADRLPAGVDGVSMAAAARAEWFVSDWHTSDGSAETEASVLAALVPGSEVDRPTYGEGSSYVEWARASDVAETDDGLRVVVLYRRIVTNGDDGWVREPVGATSVDIVFVDGVPFVAGAPEPIDVVWPGSR